MGDYGGLGGRLVMRGWGCDLLRFVAICSSTKDHPGWVLDPFLDLAEEGDGLATVDEPVVVGKRDVPDGWGWG